MGENQQVSIERSSARISIDRTGLPDFFAVGPPRTATTWLHRVLTGQVNLPRVVKEPRFFDLRYAKGLDWYRTHFQPIVPGLPVGEIAATYFYSVEARQRISKLIPDAKIICTLRDPVQRLYSLYRIKSASGAIRCSFREAIGRDRELIESNRYLFHLNGWIDLFGKDRVLVLINERLFRDPEEHLGALCRFVGIAPFTLDPAMLTPENASDVLPTPAFGRWTDLAVKVGAALNTNSYARTLAVVRKLRVNKWFLKDVPYAPPPLDRELAAELHERMRPEVEALEALLNTDLSIWKPKAA